MTEYCWKILQYVKWTSARQKNHVILCWRMTRADQDQVLFNFRHVKAYCLLISTQFYTKIQWFLVDMFVPQSPPWWCTKKLWIQVQLYFHLTGQSNTISQFPFRGPNITPTPCLIWQCSKLRTNSLCSHFWKVLILTWQQLGNPEHWLKSIFV